MNLSSHFHYNVLLRTTYGRGVTHTQVACNLFIHVQNKENSLIEIKPPVFLRKAKIDCSALWAKINLMKILGPTWSTDLFVHTFTWTNYLKPAPMARVQRLGKCVEVEVDFFSDNLRTLKTKVLSSLTSPPYVISYNNVLHPFIHTLHLNTQFL